MRYLLDLDHTLLDTERLKVEAFRVGTLALVGTPAFWDRHSATEFLYDDVLTWLNGKSPDALHILTAYKPSQGPMAESFQRGKVESCNFIHHITSVTVVDGMKGEAAAKIASQFSPHEPIAFIDDRLDQCLSVKTALPSALCFLMVRDGEPPAQVPDDIYTVTSLAEVDAIIEKI
ncbi:MAG TPA: hypothetical protein VGE31_00805 [Candidatus Paceibacterota bacterium]